jgi:lipoate-protein ligase A
LKKINIYRSTSNNVLENLALEEHLVTTSNEDVLLFYINSASVVIGKHQNPWKEVNINALDKNKVVLARRLSGGGTVYHDLGNINFSFIRTKNQDFVNFREHIEPISNTLSQLSIENEISPRNDIFINEHKVSGNAEHVNNSKKRILHHGTLLYNSNINSLGLSIKADYLDIETHAVDSVRSPVTNIITVRNLGTTKEFLDILIDKLSNEITIDSIKEITPKDFNEVNYLVKEKYSTWEWTFGHTPQFTYNKEDASYKIRKGVVIDSSNKEEIGLRCDKVIKL